MPEKVFTAGRDLRALTDTLRAKHKVVQNEFGEWVLLHYQDVVAAAKDDRTFSSGVSRFLQIPNGLDGDEHTIYRELIDKYLTAQALEPHLHKFKKIARHTVAEQLNKNNTDAVHDLGAVFAVRAQCAWLGWPQALEPKLLQWMQDNHAATRSGNTAQTEQIAKRFDHMLEQAFAYAREQAQQTGQRSVTAQLDNDEIKGRPLKEAEKVSILRNWTAGDLGSMALCIGVLMAYLAQQQLKDSAYLEQLQQYSDGQLEQWIDEVIRLDNPFISNRRISTCPTQIAGIDLPKGAVVRLNWISANRDEAVFGAEQFCPAQHAEHNIVYGVGRHICPGRLLATAQLRLFMQAVLEQVKQVQIIRDRPFVRAQSPTGGYASVPVVLQA